MLLRLLRKIQGVLFACIQTPFLWRLCSPWYWRYFWWLEYQQEKQALGLENAIPIQGSERAVLTENIISTYFLTGGPILEVGFGYGQNLVILASMIPQHEIVGVDASAERVSETTKLFTGYGYSQISLMHEDATRLPFEDNSFEIVFSSAMFLYLAEEAARRAVLEMSRVARSTLIFLEQHQEGIPDLMLPRGVDGGSYFVRDYSALFRSALPGAEWHELFVENPRWGVEKWRESARVFVVKLSASNEEVTTSMKNL